MNMLYRPTRRQFVSAAAAAAGAAFLPRGVSANPVGNAAANAPGASSRPGNRETIPWKVKPFPLKQVRLRKGPFLDALEADRRYLHLLPSERLLHTFRLNAGLASSAQPLGGWEKPDCELRGHFTGRPLPVGLRFDVRQRWRSGVEGKGGGAGRSTGRMPEGAPERVPQRVSGGVFRSPARGAPGLGAFLHLSQNHGGPSGCVRSLRERSGARRWPKAWRNGSGIGRRASATSTCNESCKRNSAA